MKRLAAVALLTVILLPGVAFAGSSTDAALGLGAFAVFNHILGGARLRLSSVRLPSWLGETRPLGPPRPRPLDQLGSLSASGTHAAGSIVRPTAAPTSKRGVGAAAARKTRSLSARAIS